MEEIIKQTKPVKPKPQFYAIMLEPMQILAKEFGYNLVVHGSMNRDLDLIAIAWVDNPKPEIELVQALDTLLRGECHTKKLDILYMHSILPGNRKSYVINLHRGTVDNNGENYTDKEWYLDISFTPIK